MVVVVPWRTSPGAPHGAILEEEGWAGDPMESMTEAQQATFVAGGGM